MDLAILAAAASQTAAQLHHLWSLVALYCSSSDSSDNSYSCSSCQMAHAHTVQDTQAHTADNFANSQFCTGRYNRCSGSTQDTDSTAAGPAYSGSISCACAVGGHSCLQNCSYLQYLQSCLSSLSSKLAHCASD